MNTEYDVYIAELCRDASVKDAAVYELDDCVIIAVLTYGVFTRSQGVALEKRAEILAQLCFDGKTAIVSRDADIFFKLKNAASDGEAQSLCEIVKSRRTI